MNMWHMRIDINIMCRMYVSHSGTVQWGHTYDMGSFSRHCHCHCHGHGQGHVVFILATYPEGKWTINPNPFSPSIIAQTWQRALVSKAPSPPTDSKILFHPAPPQTVLKILSYACDESSSTARRTSSKLGSVPSKFGHHGHKIGSLLSVPF